MKNKKANTLGVIVVILLAILIFSGIGIGIYVASGTKETAIGGEGQATGNGGTTIVTTNPIISIIGNDEQSGTTVSTSGNSYSRDSDSSYDSVTLGTTTAIPGQVIRLLLVNNTQYHNQVWNLDGAIKVQANTFPVNVQFNKNATITESLYYQNTKLTNGGGANNITNLGNGASYSLTDEMQANALTNTQDMVCIIEVEAGTNLSTDSPGVTYDGALSTNRETGSWYTPQTTASKIYTFDRPAISSTKPVTSNIYVNFKSTGGMGSAGTNSDIIKSCYVKEWFKDPTTGKLTYDVVDSQGTVKSMAIYTYTVRAT